MGTYTRRGKGICASERLSTMARRKYLKDYRIVETLNDRGGIRSDSEYIGPAYRFRDPKAAESMKQLLPGLCILSWLGYIAALLPYSAASGIFYVSLPFLFSAIPLGMLTERAISLLRGKTPIEHRSADRYNNWIGGASLMMALLSGISLAGELISFCIGMRDCVWGDAVFAVGSLVLLCCGIVIRRRAGRLLTEQQN